MFGATADEAVSATGRCPALHHDDDVEAVVAEKASKDEAKVAELVASGVKPIRTIYADGGQNPVFAGYKDTSDPDALVSGPQDIVLDEGGMQAPAVVKVATDAPNSGLGIRSPSSRSPKRQRPRRRKRRLSLRACPGT